MIQKLITNKCDIWLSGLINIFIVKGINYMDIMEFLEVAFNIIYFIGIATVVIIYERYTSKKEKDRAENYQNKNK